LIESHSELAGATHPIRHLQVASQLLSERLVSQPVAQLRAQVVQEVPARLQEEQPVGRLPELVVQAERLVRLELRGRRGLQVQRLPELVLVRLLSALR
jgi:hypothetical protein